MPVISSPALGSPIWFDVMSSDPEAARKFYSALFGWTFEVGGPDTNFYAMGRKGGSNVAGMGPMPPGAPMPSAWNVYFGVASADETAKRVTDAGGQVMMAPMDVMEFGRMAMCADPTGAMFGLWQPGTHTGSQLNNEHGAMAWSEVNTRDIDRATSFYGNVFDLGASPMEGSPSPYNMLMQNGEPVAGAMQMTPEWGEMPPHWMPYFAVDSIDSAVKTVADNGGTVAHGPFDTPYGRMAVIIDPQGAAVSIIQLSQQAS
ncbi:MAG TPA: VOC family protein [Gemmatimonas sp.]|nr:VOC family protein [Gemmatimonas sp.]